MKPIKSFDETTFIQCKGKGSYLQTKVQKSLQNKLIWLATRGLGLHMKSSLLTDL